MSKAIAVVIVLAAVFGGFYWLNEAMTTQDNITCVKQTGAGADIRYYLCIAGQQQPQYVPYSVWHTARVGGYYDDGTHTAYKSVDDDSHVSHGIGGDGGEGHGGEGHGGGGHGGGGE